MKRSTLLILGGLAVLALALAIAGSILHDGLSAKAKPSALETVLARNARRLAIPASAKKEQNSVLDSPEVQREARLHFADHCATCHSNDGSGHTLYGDGLYPKPPDLRLPSTQDLTDGELFWIIENGVRFTGMPAFSSDGNHGSSRNPASSGNHAASGIPAALGNHDSAQDSWKLVHFIRHLPRLTEAERIEMERFNPKSVEDQEEEQNENEFLNGATPKEKQESQKKRQE